MPGWRVCFRTQTQGGLFRRSAALCRDEWTGRSRTTAWQFKAPEGHRGAGVAIPELESLCPGGRSVKSLEVCAASIRVQGELQVEGPSDAHQGSRSH